MDQPHTIMPGSVSGTHLVECPQCHASNGITAVRCWNCDSALPPELQAVSSGDLASESAWPKDAFAGVNLSGAASRDDGTSTAAANTPAFDARTAGLDLPQTSRSERRARLAASAAADVSMALPSDLFGRDKTPSGPMAMGEALTGAGMAPGEDDSRSPLQSSTLDEQARAAIPDWKPEPWKPSMVSSLDATGSEGAEPAGSSTSEPAAMPESAEREPAKPVEFFPQFQAVRPANPANPAATDRVDEAASIRGRPAGRPEVAAPAKSASASAVDPLSTGPSTAIPQAPSGPASPTAAADDVRRPGSNRPPPLTPATDETRGAGSRPRRMTPEEIAATFRAPIRRHPWQDPRWLGAGAAALAVIIGLGVFFYPSTVDESDWTPASTRGLVEQRGAARDPQAILDGEPVGGPVVRPARDPQAILNGEPTSAGADVATTPDAQAASTPVESTPSSRAAASAAIDALLATPSATVDAATSRQSRTTSPAPAAAPAPAPLRTPADRPQLVDPTPSSTTGCAPNVLALGLCPTP